MKSPPEKRLDPDVLQRFVALCRKSEIAAGTMIINAAELSDRLYYLIDGSVEVIIEDDDGHEMILAYLNKGHFFGEMGFFNRNEQTRSAWVRARSPSVVAELGYDEFAVLAQEHRALVVELTTQMALRLYGADAKLGSLAFLDVKGRVAHVLLELCQEPDAQRDEQGRRVRVSHPQLARLTGCSREMVWRVIQMLQSEGLIVSDGDGIVVRNYNHLQAPASA